MPEISSLRRPKPTPATVGFDGETISLVYDMNLLTPALLELSIDEVLPAVVQEWDVTDAGAPFPPTRENIGSLSYGLQRELMRSIVETATVSSAEGNASPASAPVQSSDSTPPSGTSLNGSDSSTSQTASESASLT